MARVRQVEDDPRVSADALVGREEELRAIDALLGGAPERGGALLVRGEPGIGKSTLLAQARRRGGAAGLRVLTAAGVQSESDLPFAGLHQLLRPVLDHLGALAGPQRDALQSAFGLGERPAPDRFLIALAALDLLSEAADAEPLLAIVEDAHWLDRASADVLAFVARRLESDPIVLIAALRDGFESPLAAAGLPELALERLDAADAESLLDGRAPGLARGLRERILREAGGNPLALVELPIAIERLGDRVLPPADLPLTDRLEHAFAVRAAELPERTRALLLVAAFDDGESLGTVLAAGEGLGEGLSIADLSPAVAAGLLEMDETRIRFRHPLVRSAIRRAAGPGRRQQIHASLARALAGEPERAVWHRAAAVVGTDEAVAGELEATAAAAIRRGGLATAVAALERAAALTAEHGRRVRLLLEAAEHGFELGQRALVERLLDEAETYELAPLDRARVTWIRESFDDGVPGAAAGARRLVDVAEQTAAAGDEELALDLLGGAALRCWWGDPDEGTRRRLVGIVNRLRPASSDPKPVAILGWADPIDSGAEVVRRLRGSRPARTSPAAACACTGWRRPPSPTTSSRRCSCAPRSTAYATTGRRRCSPRRWCCAAGAPCTSAPGPRRSPTSRRAAGSRASRRSPTGPRELARARRCWPGSAATATARTCWPARSSGSRCPAARPRRWRTSSSRAASRRWPWATTPMRTTRSPASSTPADPAHHYMKSTWAIGDLAEAAAYSGRVEEVAEPLARVNAVAQRTPGPRIHVALRHARAMLAAPGEEEILFLDALGGGLDAWPFARARLQLAYGAWLRRERRVSESRVPLRAARDAFDVLGGSPWGERARQELRASGESSRRRSADARDELTPQELQIAELAAGGLSNREIGQRLYLSHRTVGSHLYRVFPKLGVTSRGELRDALTE